MDVRSSIVAMTFSSPPQFGQCAMEYTHAIERSQAVKWNVSHAFYECQAKILTHA